MRKRALVVLSALTLVACSSNSDAPLAPVRADAPLFNRGGIQPNLISVSPSNVAVSVGGTAQLTATVTNKHGDIQPDRPVTFESSNPAVATVSATGAVTGVATGTATITVSTGGSKPIVASATVTVGVEAPVVTIHSPLEGEIVGPHSFLLFTVQGIDVVLTCEIDGDGLCILGDGEVELILSDGPHEVRITAQNEGGRGQASVFFQVDARGPEWRSHFVPPSPVDPALDTRIWFEAFDQLTTSVAFRCRLDGAVVACANTSATRGEFRLSGLPDGEHEFTVVAIDRFNNASPPLTLRFQVASP